jgi:hypothetical protein
MSLRPGWQFIGGTHLHRPARHIPFVFSVSDTAIIELTDHLMRVLVNDKEVTRPDTADSILINGDFNVDLAGWTDFDQGSFATSAWVAGGFMSLLGDGTLGAIREQTVNLLGSGEHALRVVVRSGVLVLRVGSITGGNEYIPDTYLGPGIHSLAFTPTGNFYVRLLNRNDSFTIVDSVTLEAPGSMMIPTPWAESDLSKIRYVQSGDTIFVACEGVPPTKIERRGKTSWSVVAFLPDDGPFMVENLTSITMASTSITGQTTLNASGAYFTPANVGSLFSLQSSGQVRDKAISAANVFTDPIEITGLTIDRNLHIATSGTWAATLTLQRSVGAPGGWIDVTNYTTNQNVDYNDGLDNQIVYYRLGAKTGNFTSGMALVTLSFPHGSITGVIRTTAYISSTQMIGDIISDIGSLVPVTTWAESAWSVRRGFPSAVAIHEGRLWWAGKDRLWGSASDAYYTYGLATVEGDAGAISRSIGIGPVDTINWLISAEGLIMGGFGSEFLCRSSSLDEPITPSNFKIKRGTTVGSAQVDPILIDASVMFVDRTLGRIYELTTESFGATYAIKELTALTPEIGRPGVVRTAVQRKIDTRIHCILADGSAAVMIFDKLEEVNCWVKVQTFGFIEDVVVLPSGGSEEDIVYYVVRRTINGQTRRYLERWALTSECEGGALNKQADSFIIFSGPEPAQLITGLDHLEGEFVVAWGDGRDLGGGQVINGAISLPVLVNYAVIGVSYSATFVSTKLAYAAQSGSALTQKKRLDHLGLILRNTHYQGLQYGDSFYTLDDLPLVEEGSVTPADTVWDSYDADSVEFNGAYDTDSRLHLRANSPRPCTVLAAVFSMSTYEKL